MNERCVLVSSHPKSGTNLIAHLIKHITDYTNIKTLVNKYKSRFISLIDYPEAKDIVCGRIHFAEDGRMGLHFVILDKNNLIPGTVMIYTDRAEIEKLAEDRRCFAVEHISPGCFFKNSMTEYIRYKIFVSRDFRDVYNSRAKYVSRNRHNAYRAWLLKDYEEFRRFSYLNIKSFHEHIQTWKQYVSEYFEHEDELFLLKYENLMSDPHKTVTELAEYLDFEIDSEGVDSIVAKLFNKELTLGGGKTDVAKMCRHFSGSQKRYGEWKKWFSPYMADEVKKEIGGLLVRLGYENGTDWTVDEPETDFCETFRKKQDFIAKAYESGGIKIDSNMLDDYLKDKDAVFYGAGNYALKLIQLLQNRKNIRFIVDDSKEKQGTDICGIPVVHPDSLIVEYMKYDVIVVAVQSDFFDDVYENITNMFIDGSIVINGYFDLASPD